VTLACIGSLVNAATHDHQAPVVLAPGYADLAFVPPAPGSYQLPGLGLAVDAEVLDSAGRKRQLAELFGDKLVVLSFIYTSCSDVNGCPLATHVFSKVQDALLAADDLTRQVRLISLSFDPDYDKPAVMRDYGDGFRKPDSDWQFLTTESIPILEPTLMAYDQWVVRDYDEAGNSIGSMSHVLRVYLIDRQRQIRNIYSVSFLHVDTIINDLRTVLLQEAADSGS
jgi:cytochrome c peroxidase